MYFLLMITDFLLFGYIFSFTFYLVASVNGKKTNKLLNSILIVSMSVFSSVAIYRGVQYFDYKNMNEACIGPKSIIPYLANSIASLVLLI